MKRRWLAAGLATAVLVTALAVARPGAAPPPGPPAAAPKIPAGPGSPERAADVQVTGHIVKPPELPPPDLSQLKVPVGFRVERFATDLGNARILAVSPAGRVYVTRRD